MKYYILKNIITYINNNYKSIKLIKRVDNNTILIEFAQKKAIYFDLSKGNSMVYKKDNLSSKKDYNAPFDVVLKKRFINSKIVDIKLYNDDKIINIDVLSSSSYKQLKTTLQLEFTGKYTNIIILDENRVVLEALRHIDEDSSSRIVKVGSFLEEIPKPNFEYKIEELENVEEYLYEVYKQKEQKLLQGIKKQKTTILNKKIKKINRLLSSLDNKEELEELSNSLYEKGNLILSNLHNIKAYQKDVEVYDFEGKLIKIDLDPNYPNPSSFANNLFTKAKKAKQKAKYLHLEKDNLEQKLTFLNRMILNIDSCESIDEIEFLMPKKEKNQKKTKKDQMYQSFFYGGYRILLGSDERENIWLLQNSRATDFWFHLKDATSAHVIVPTSKKSLPENIIEKAAQICAKFSSDFGGRYKVDYTQRRNVKIQNRANVLYNPYTTITVNV